MFVNSQGTTLLHGALMSAVNLLQSSKDQDPAYKKVFQLRDKKGVANVISSTILRVTHNPTKVKSAVEFLLMQQDVHRKLHAAVFFVALRSNGITCTEADKYYESLPQNFPSMDWRFYLKLNYQCSWSEYFIECAVQLEPDILASVIKGLLPCFKEDDLKCYTWHLALQSIIWKFFQFDDPTIVQVTENPKIESVFDFPFTDSQASQSKEQENQAVCSDNPARSKLLFEYVTILNHMLQSSSTSFHFVKVILHFYKTTFKLIKKLNTCNGESIKELFRMHVLLESCFKNEAFLEAISSSLVSRSKFSIDHVYVTTSWEIGTSYLLFLLFNYLKDADDRFSEDKAGCLDSISSIMPQVDKDLLSQLCPLYKERFGENDDSDLELLKAMIRYDYPFASRAAGIILKHPEIRNKTEIINMLNENMSTLLPFEIYPVLADAVVETQPENKSSFTDLFFKLLSSAPNCIYNDALNYILDSYGINDHFKLSDTNSCVTKFTRKTMLLDEAQKFLLPLFIQEPLTVLKSIIEQALIRGAEGIAIIPVLKLVPSVCFHKDSYSFLLINELSLYFAKENLLTFEEKNIVSLVEAIMKVQTEKEIISFDKFLEDCILPSFYKNIRLDITLECLNVSLKTLNNEATLQLSDSSFFALLECLSLSIKECIITGNGKRKELLLLALTLLGENKMLHGKFEDGATHFNHHLSIVDQVVTVYLKPFYSTEIYQDTFNGLSGTSWIYCCHSENPEQEFKERLTSLRTAHKYNSLLKTLFPLLSHFTKKEWAKSADFLKIYFEYYSPDELCCSVPSLLPKTDPQLYAVVRTLMDCYIYLLKKSACDKQYVTSCFTNTIIDIVGQKSHPQLLLNVFLDACHMVSICEMDTLDLLSSFLISIKQSIFVACDGKSLQESYVKLALTGVKCLPDTTAKTLLLKKI